MKHFKNTKIFTLLIAVALILALSISCKSNENPKDPVEIPSQYYGTWKYSSGTNALQLEGSISGSTKNYSLTFWKTDGTYLNGASISSTGGSDTLDWSDVNVTKNSDTSWSWQGYTFSFSSSTEGTLSYEGHDYPIKK